MRKGFTFNRDGHCYVFTPLPKACGCQGTLTEKRTHSKGRVPGVKWRCSVNSGAIFLGNVWPLYIVLCSCSEGLCGWFGVKQSTRSLGTVRTRPEHLNVSEVSDPLNGKLFYLAYLETESSHSTCTQIVITSPLTPWHSGGEKSVNEC